MAFLVRRWLVRDGTDEVDVVYYERTRIFTCSRCGSQVAAALCIHALAAQLQALRVIEREAYEEAPQIRRRTHFPALLSPEPAPTPELIAKDKLDDCCCVHPVSFVCASMRTGSSFLDAAPCDCRCHTGP